LHHQLHRRHIRHNHVNIRVDSYQLREDAREEQYQYDERGHGCGARLVSEPDNAHQHHQPYNTLYQLGQRPVPLHPVLHVEQRGAGLVKAVVVIVLRAVYLGYLHRLPEVVYVFEQPVVGVHIPFTQAERARQEPAHGEERKCSHPDDYQREPGRDKQRVEGVCAGHDDRGEEAQVEEVVGGQVGHLAGEHLQMVGLAATVQQLPVGHDDLAEQPSAKGVYECLLVPGIEERLQVLNQSTKGKQYHVHHKYAADGDLYAGAFGEVAYGKRDAVRLSFRAYAQQLQQRDKQYNRKTPGHPLQ